MPADLEVFAKDYPETRLVVEVRSAVSSPPERDPAVREVARRLWGATAHYGLVITPSNTYVLRDDFTTLGPESIRVTDILPTKTLLSRLGWPAAEPISDQQLKRLTHDWLERLVTSYEAALPEDPDVLRALFPDIVGAVAEGRVVAEAAV
jgi:hypothetical protein